MTEAYTRMTHHEYIVGDGVHDALFGRRVDGCVLEYTINILDVILIKILMHSKILIQQLHITTTTNTFISVRRSAQ